MTQNVLLLIVLMAFAAQAAADPYVIVPGQGFGQFRAALGCAGLEKLTGQGEFGEGEQGGQPSAEIFMMNPAKRIALLLDGKKTIRAMAIHGDRSMWHTREGITLGTYLSALEKLNGKAFRFRSFEGEHGGEITDWCQGKLAGALPRVKITFASPMHARGYNRLSGEEKSQIEEQRVYSSSDPVARKLDPVVETIELDF
jgi:hypothetical protein